MTTSESFIRVISGATGSALGKDVRNLKWTYIDNTGATVTRYIQVISIVDENGNPVDFDTGVQDEILVELRRIRLGLQIQTGNGLKLDDALRG